MAEQEISQDETNLLRELKKQEADVNEIFRDIGLKYQDVLNSSSSPLSQTNPDPQILNDQYSYLKRYQKFSISSIKSNYQKSFLPFKWYQLPFCRNIIYEKTLFCIPASIPFTVIYLFYKYRQKRKIEWSVKNFTKAYIPITLLCMGFVFIQSLMTEPYCDINSHHYDEKISNLQRVKLSKKYMQHNFYTPKDQPTKLNKN